MGTLIYPAGPSIVNSGTYAGKTLVELIKSYPEILGNKYKDKGDIPILIKFIDAQKDLSLQVHPDDEYARLNENGSMGKTEMWYVVDATEEARLVYGFYHDMDEAVVRKGLEDGSIEKYLHKVKVEKDDVFFVQAGTVHAIGAGALMAEIQESSNLTYRMYDYNRVDKAGNKRELHIDKAMAVANLKSSAKPRQPMRLLKYRAGQASEIICRCKYFQVERMLINTERHRDMATMQTGEETFNVLLCVGGCGTLFSENEMLPFLKGDCIFVPANSAVLKIHGQTQLLRISC